MHHSIPQQSHGRYSYISIKGWDGTGDRFHHANHLTLMAAKKLKNMHLDMVWLNVSALVERSAFFHQSKKI